MPHCSQPESPTCILLQAPVPPGDQQLSSAAVSCDQSLPHITQCAHWHIEMSTPAAWRSGNIVGRINAVTLRRARLVLGWVTVFGGQTTSVFHQATQANSVSYPQQDGK